jgi:uncharacterized protein YceK
MKQIIMASVIAAVAVATTGCGTLVARNGFDAGVKPYPYPGVVQDISGFVTAPHKAISQGDPNEVLGMPFMLVDVPLSAFVDTVILPADIAQWAKH